MIPYGRQDITEADIRAVVQVLQSDFLTQGPAVATFERGVASRVHAKHAVAVNSATSALHVACAALGLGPGDRLWTVPNTFVASANCGLYCGATVDFVDIDPVTWNMSVPALRERLAEAERTGHLPKIVIPVHFAGQATDQEAIWELAQAYGFRVIEDASHAIGAAHNGEPVGSCRWSDITVFSFHPVKIITTGEGGMALTNDADLFERMAMIRSHGITRNPERFVAATTAPDEDVGAWYYEQQMLGFNYRMIDIEAALGSSQLERLDAYVTRRNELAARYDRALAGIPVQRPTVRPENRSAFHLYVVRVRSRAERAAAFAQLRALGVGVNVHYLPVHLQPYFRTLGFSPGQFPEAEAHGATAITLPLYATLTDELQDRVVECMHTVLRHS